jgi:hypothetical protein
LIHYTVYFYFINKSNLTSIFNFNLKLMRKFTTKLLIRRFNGFAIVLMLLLYSATGQSQTVGFSATGATPPNPSAGLDVNYTSQGMLIPRIALTGTTSFAPFAAHVAGMVVYNTATVADVTPGIYYNNGTKWIATQPKATASGDMQYWNGTQWVNVPIGTPGQFLKISSSGIPTWGP